MDSCLDKNAEDYYFRWFLGKYLKNIPIGVLSYKLTLRVFENRFGGGSKIIREP